jgi:small subunit ribosomal protein S4
MAKTSTLSPSCKLCRREGEKLFLKGERCYTAKCAIVRRKFIPGQHGVARQPRLTEYGTQLRAKQKAKRTYGIMERQFLTYYKKAVAKPEDSEQALKRLLEMRLDNVVYRLGFAVSRALARQMISHGHITVNGKKLDIASYQAKIGDIVGISSFSKDLALVKNLDEKLKTHQLQSWLLVDLEKKEGKVLSVPSADDMRDTIEAKQIIEFYSRF